LMVVGLDWTGTGATRLEEWADAEGCTEGTGSWTGTELDSWTGTGANSAAGGFVVDWVVTS